VPPEAELAGGAEAARAIVRMRLAPGGVIVAIAVAAAVAFAWWRLIAMGGATAPMGAGNVWTAAYLGGAFAMWALMMVAMMLPSASPMILLY
jgi:predicted metal-binding membrane protein